MMPVMFRNLSPGVRLTRALAALVVCGATACSRQAEAPAASKPAEPVETAPIGSAGTLYVTNEVGGDLSVVDVANRKVVATIPLGKRPRGIRASPDGTLLYVSLSGSPIAGPGVDASKLPPPDKRADGIGIVDVKARRLRTVLPGGSDPEQAAVSADGTRLYIANEDTGQVTVLNAENGDVVGTVKVGGEPEGVNLEPDGKAVWVTSEEDSAVFVIDTAKPRVRKKIEVGPRPRSTTFLPDGSRAYVPSENGGDVRVIDTKSYKEVGVVKLNGQLQRPMGGVVSPDGKTLYMTTGRGKTVAVIDTATNQHVASIEVGERPWGIAMSPDGKMLFTANGTSNDVSFVDAATRAVVAKVKVGDRPWGVVYQP
jgi:YVTN family beta-propeller protein